MSDNALTRDFKETVRARLACDDAFARALLDEVATLFPKSGSPSPEEQEARLQALRAALIEGEQSGPSTPFDFAAFLDQKAAQT